ncbi:MAG: glycosyltransferase family 2 protein [Planctomycetota bacterium]
MSVVVPAFDRAALAVEAPEGVFAQTLSDLEAILVDDGSTDGTSERVAERFAGEERLRLVQKPNGGAASARNRGLDEARGTYVTLLDCDDLLLPHALASQAALLDAQPDADLAFCDARYEGGWKQDGQTVFTRRHYRPPTSLEALLDGAWAIASQITVRRATAGDLRFDETYRVVEDLEYLFRFFLAGHRAVLNPEVLVRYRKHGAQAMDDGDAIRLATIRVLEQYTPPGGGSRIHRYQVARRKAVHLARQGRLREARPHLVTWIGTRFSSRALRWLLKSFVRPNG